VGLLTWQVAEKLVAGKGKGKRQKGKRLPCALSLLPDAYEFFINLLKPIPTGIDIVSWPKREVPL
jgi:hypothetical protein